MNSTNVPPKRGEKKKVFADAHSAGLETIDWHCKNHAWTTFLVAGGRGRCKACREDQNNCSNAKAKKRYQSDEVYRASRRKKESEAFARKGTDAQVRGRRRELAAARKWRRVTGGAMHAWYEIERPAVQRIYTGLIAGMEIDHAIPKRALDAEGNHVATGLHCFANLDPVSMRLNRRKGTYFSPEEDRRQRPANRGPGGAFDPSPTEHEWGLIREMIASGHSEAESHALLRDLIDRKANAYEAHCRDALGSAFPQSATDLHRTQISDHPSFDSLSTQTVQWPQPSETK